MTRLNFDLANQNNLFWNNCDIIFEIKPHSDNFLLHTPKYTKIEEQGANKEKVPVIGAVGGTYRINIHEIKLYCTLVYVVQSLQNQIARQLESTPQNNLLEKLIYDHIFSKRND